MISLFWYALGVLFIQNHNLMKSIDVDHLNQSNQELVTLQKLFVDYVPNRW